MTNFAKALGLSWACICLSAGCVASFPEHQVARLSQIASKDGSSYKPSVLLDVSFYFDTGNRINEHRRSQAFKGIVAKVSDESEMFSRYTMNVSESSEFEYAIKMKLVNHGSMNAAIAAGVISGASLGLIPTAVTDHFKLTAIVADRSNNDLKAYEVNDAVTSWFGFWTFFPSDESAERKVFYAVWENMVRNLYQQILDDGLLSSRPSSPG